MNRSWRLLSWSRGTTLALLTTAALMPQPLHAKRPVLNAAEKQQLPRYCWAQHVDSKYAGVPGHSIPPNCGKGMNHLCTAHIHVIASQRAGARPRDRKFQAQKAVANFAYTQRHMTPQCPLRAEVNVAAELAKLQQRNVK